VKNGWFIAGVGRSVMSLLREAALTDLLVHAGGKEELIVILGVWKIVFM
jgi:hypothetical protein